jgi:hypothetical protein
VVSTKIVLEVDLTKDSDPLDFADKLQELLFIAFDDENAWPEVDVFLGTDVMQDRSQW